MAEQTPPSANGRDPTTGRFVVGYEGGPGNPFAGQINKLRSAILKAVTPEDITALFRAGFEMAMDKNNKAAERVQAARFVAEYAIGKPQPAEVTIGSNDSGGLTVIINRESDA